MDSSIARRALVAVLTVVVIGSVVAFLVFRATSPTANPSVAPVSPSSSSTPGPDADPSAPARPEASDGGGSDPVELDPEDASSVAATFASVFSAPEADYSALEASGALDPTFASSLPGADRSPAQQAEHQLGTPENSSDHSSEIYEFPVLAADGSELYVLTVQRPMVDDESGEGDFEAGGPFRITALEWSEALFGDDASPGPLLGAQIPMTPGMREGLLSTGESAAMETISFVVGETPEERSARLSLYMAQPQHALTVPQPVSRDGRYPMRAAVLTRAFTTTPGGAPAALYSGTWVDPYDPSYNGSWSVTVTWRPIAGTQGLYEIADVQETSISANPNGLEE